MAYPKVRAARLASKIVVYLFLLVGVLIMVYPILFILMVSFFTPTEFNTLGVSFFPIAQKPTLANIQQLFLVNADRYTLIYYLNSLFRTAYGTFFACLTSLLAGYVFGRLRFKGKNILFLVLLATQMLPGIMSIMPTFLELYRFPFAGGNFVFMGGRGLYNSYGVYILLNGGAINIMGTFLVKQNIEAIPASMEEAAKVDGAGTPRLIFSIVFPLVRAVLAYIAITQAIGIWNDWQTPFYYTTSRELQTIASALSKLSSFAGQEGSQVNYPAMMTFSLMLTVPSAIIFLVFQKNIIEGLVSAGIKG